MESPRNWPTARWRKHREMENKERELVVIAEGKHYMACYDANADPFEVLEGGKPSYYVFNRETNRIEAAVASAVSAIGLIPQMDKAMDDVMDGDIPLDVDNLPESGPTLN